MLGRLPLREELMPQGEGFARDAQVLEQRTLLGERFVDRMGLR